MSKRTPLSFSLDAAVTPPPLASIKEPQPQQTPEPEQKAIARPKGTSRAGRQFIAAHVLPEAAKQFKLLALQQDRSVKDLLIEAINDLFAKYGMSRIADK